MLFTRLLSPLPSQCALCRDWGSERVCDACLQRFTTDVPRCVRCAIEVPAGVDTCGRCLTHPTAWTHAVTAVDYAYPWDSLIASMKYGDALDLVSILAEQLARVAERSPRPQCLLPIPLSAHRLAERGYNQAWELARRVATSLHVEADPQLLLRVKDTPDQRRQTREHRVSNVRGAFAVEPLRRGEIAGRHIALVDDVMTTGATCDEAARTLLAAGAARVDVWVLARTPSPENR